MEPNDIGKRFNYQPGDRVRICIKDSRYDQQIGVVDSLSGSEPDETGASKLWTVRVRFPDGWTIMFAARELVAMDS